MERIKQRIKENYNSLTQRLKTVANFIVDNPKQVALYHAKEIGKLTGTSETTVIRCCNVLGYSGYSEVQEEIRKALLLPDDNPLKALTDGINTNNTLLSTIDQDIDYIGKIYAEISEVSYQETVNSIINARKITVIGLRNSYAPAYWFANILNMIKGNTSSFKGDLDDGNYLLTVLDEDCLIIALSFQRYAKQTTAFVKAAKDKGVKVLAITDDEFSPVGLISDITIKAVTPKPTTLKGMPTVFAILNVIISGVMATDKQRVERRIEEYNQTKEYYYEYYQKDD